MLFVSIYIPGVLHDFHVKWGSCRLTTAQRMPLVEQHLITLPEHLWSYF